MINSGDWLDPPRLTPQTVYGITGVLVGAGNTTSAAYVDLPTSPSTSFEFVKRRSDSRVKISMKLMCYSSAASTGAMIGASLNGVTRDVARQFFTAVSYMPIIGWTYVSGVPAGTYTLQARWQRTAGAGALTIGAGISELDFEAMEVW